MSTTDTVKLRGVIVPLSSERTCRVALMDGEVEYPILPRGAGIDLADMVGSQLDVACVIQEEGDVKRLLVRSYTVLGEGQDDDTWFPERE